MTNVFLLQPRSHVSCSTAIKKKKIHFLAVLGLSCCTGFSLLVVSEGYFLVVVGRLLIVGASLVTEHRLQVSRLQQLWLNCSGA